MSNSLTAIGAFLILALVSCVISFYVVGWAVVYWTFKVNALWGVIALIAWLLIGKLLSSRS